ncbi:hypothetical protein DITRI_Ditri20bG0060700 [Diplodiscus trichospermus]
MAPLGVGTKEWSTGCPIPTVAASKAPLELDQIQGKRGIWFCGEILPYSNELFYTWVKKCNSTLLEYLRQE